METSKSLLKDKNAKDVDVHLYRSMIGSLMYLTSSRPDIMFVVCAYARFQVTPKVSHLHAMKRNFRYLKGQPNLGLWYLKDSPFDLDAYNNSDYASASLDRKFTTGGYTVNSGVNVVGHYLVLPGLTYYCKLGKLTTAVDVNVVEGDDSVSIHLSMKLCLFIDMLHLGSSLKLFNARRIDCKTNLFWNNQLEELANHTRIYVLRSHTKKVFANMKRQGKDFSGRVTPLFPTMIVQAQQEKTNKPRIKDTELPHTSVPTEVVAYEDVYVEMYGNMERAATTATGLDAEQDKGIISKTQFMATLNEPSSIGTSSGSGPRCQKTIGDDAAQTRSERVSKFSNDPPLSILNTLRSGEDIQKLTELIKLCTQLQSRVLVLETTKTNQSLEIRSLKRRVNKLEKTASKRTYKLKRLYKIGSSGRIESSNEAS
nr:uncharacterized mitochondrial protein AtMg00810-like [Tanacetum cinerariifolium]